MDTTPEKHLHLITSHQYETFYNDHPDHDGTYSDATIDAITGIDSVMIKTDINAKNNGDERKPASKLYEYFRGGMPVYTVDFSCDDKSFKLRLYEEKDSPVTLYEGLSFAELRDVLASYSLPQDSIAA